MSMTMKTEHTLTHSDGFRYRVTLHPEHGIEIVYEESSRSPGDVGCVWTPKDSMEIPYKSTTHALALLLTDLADAMPEDYS